MINARTRLFAILWLGGMAGVLSVLLIDLSAVLANLPATAGLEMPFHPLLIKLLSVVQTAILLSIAIFIGIQLAPRRAIMVLVVSAVKTPGHQFPFAAFALNIEGNRLAVARGSRNRDIVLIKNVVR